MTELADNPVTDKQTVNKYTAVILSLQFLFTFYYKQLIRGNTGGPARQEGCRSVDAAKNKNK